VRWIRIMVHWFDFYVCFFGLGGELCVENGLPVPC
jgi:hypothetical protein